jgi:hypothetical protein
VDRLPRADRRRETAQGRPMTAATRCVVVVVLGWSASSALADDQTTEQAPAAASPVGLRAGLLYTDGHVTAAESGNFLALGWFPANDFTIYAGLGFTYDPNGSVKDALALGGTASDKVAADLVLAAGYFVIDNPKRNIYMGPELVWITNLAPESIADVSVVEVAWAVRYGLWKTPVAIGTDLGISFTSAYGAKGPVVSTAPFGLHIVYAFN